LCAISAIAAPAFAGVGASPADVHSEGLLRGGYAESFISVSNPGAEPQLVTIRIQGETAGWSIAEPNNFTVTGHGYKLIRIIVQPPIDMPNGIYKSTIYITSMDLQAAAAAQQGLGVTVAAGVGVMQYVTITDVEVRQYIIEGISVPDTEECRQVQVIASARNTGNVRLNANFDIDITGSAGEAIKNFNYTSEEMLPTKPYNFVIRTSPDFAGFTCMPTGSYNAKISALLDENVIFTTVLPFNIVPRGTLTMFGVLQNLTLPANATLGETVKIEGTFKNTGQLPELAKLSAEIYKGNKLSKIIEGDAIEANLGETKTLNAYWKPGWPGKYTIKAAALYEGKSTDIIEASIKVMFPTWLIYAVAIIIIATAVIALILMIRPRKTWEQ